MKKSSLLALSMASFVALVGCGKQSNALSAKAFDKEACKLAVDYFVEGTTPEALTALFSYEQVLTVSGRYADEETPAGTHRFSGSFHIKYVVADYEWVVDPQDGEEWTADDLEAAQDLVDDAGLQYTVCNLAFLVVSGMDYDREKEEYFCTYFQDLEETYKEYEEQYKDYNLKLRLNFAKSPLTWGQVEQQSGTNENSGVKWDYEAIDSYSYNNYGYMTKHVNSEGETDKGISDKTLDGSFVLKQTFEIKYLTYDE